MAVFIRLRALGLGVRFARGHSVVGDVDDLNQFLYRTHIPQEVKVFDHIQIRHFQLWFRGKVENPPGPEERVLKPLARQHRDDQYAGRGESRVKPE